MSTNEGLGGSPRYCPTPQQMPVPAASPPPPAQSPMMHSGTGGHTMTHGHHMQQQPQQQHNPQMGYYNYNQGYYPGYYGMQQQAAAVPPPVPVQQSYAQQQQPPPTAQWSSPHHMHQTAAPAGYYQQQQPQHQPMAYGHHQQPQVQHQGYVPPGQTRNPMQQHQMQQQQQQLPVGQQQPHHPGHYGHQMPTTTVPFGPVSPPGKPPPLPSHHQQQPPPPQQQHIVQQQQQPHQGISHQVYERPPSQQQQPPPQQMPPHQHHGGPQGGPAPAPPPVQSQHALMNLSRFVTQNNQQPPTQPPSAVRASSASPNMNPELQRVNGSPPRTLPLKEDVSRGVTGSSSAESGLSGRQSPKETSPVKPGASPRSDISAAVSTSSSKEAQGGMMPVRLQNMGQARTKGNMKKLMQEQHDKPNASAAESDAVEDDDEPPAKRAKKKAKDKVPKATKQKTRDVSPRSRNSRQSKELEEIDLTLEDEIEDEQSEDEVPKRVLRRSRSPAQATPTTPTAAVPKRRGRKPSSSVTPAPETTPKGKKKGKNIASAPGLEKKTPGKRGRKKKSETTEKETNNVEEEIAFALLDLKTGKASPEKSRNDTSVDGTASTAGKGSRKSPAKQSSKKKAESLNNGPDAKTPSKKRGRKPKSSLAQQEDGEIETSKEAEERSSPVPRKRGRPPKAKMEVPQPTSNATVSYPVTQSALKPKKEVEEAPETLSSSGKLEQPVTSFYGSSSVTTNQEEEMMDFPVLHIPEVPSGSPLVVQATVPEKTRFESTALVYQTAGEPISYMSLEDVLSPPPLEVTKTEAEKDLSGIAATPVVTPAPKKRGRKKSTEAKPGAPKRSHKKKVKEEISGAAAIPIQATPKSKKSTKKEAAAVVGEDGKVKVKRGRKKKSEANAAASSSAIESGTNDKSLDDSLVISMETPKPNAAELQTKVKGKRGRKPKIKPNDPPADTPASESQKLLTADDLTHSTPFLDAKTKKKGKRQSASPIAKPTENKQVNTVSSSVEAQKPEVKPKGKAKKAKAEPSTPDTSAKDSTAADVNKPRKKGRPPKKKPEGEVAEAGLISDRSKTPGSSDPSDTSLTVEKGSDIELASVNVKPLSAKKSPTKKKQQQSKLENEVSSPADSKPTAKTKRKAQESPETVKPKKAKMSATLDLDSIPSTDTKVTPDTVGTPAPKKRGRPRKQSLANSAEEDIKGPSTSKSGLSAESSLLANSADVGRRSSDESGLEEDAPHKPRKRLYGLEREQAEARELDTIMEVSHAFDKPLPPLEFYYQFEHQPRSNYPPSTPKAKKLSDADGMQQEAEDSGLMDQFEDDHNTSSLDEKPSTAAPQGSFASDAAESVEAVDMKPKAKKRKKSQVRNDPEVITPVEGETTNHSLVTGQTKSSSKALSSVNGDIKQRNSVDEPEGRITFIPSLASPVAMPTISVRKFRTKSGKSFDNQSGANAKEENGEGGPKLAERNKSRGKKGKNAEKQAGPSLKVVEGLVKFFRGSDEEDISTPLTNIKNKRPPEIYDPTVPWVCVFCGMPTQTQRLGDLFGPYYINVEREKLEDVTEGISQAARNRKSSILEYARQAKLKDKRETWFHEDCALWAGGVIPIGYSIRGLDQAVYDASRTKCSICQNTGATIGCIVRGCREAAHFPCAKRLQWSLDEDTFHSYCQAHKT